MVRKMYVVESVENVSENALSTIFGFYNKYGAIVFLDAVSAVLTRYALNGNQSIITECHVKVTELFRSGYGKTKVKGGRTKEESFEANAWVPLDLALQDYFLEHSEFVLLQALVILLARVDEEIYMDLILVCKKRIAFLIVSKQAPGTSKVVKEARSVKKKGYRK
jgi:hypothetical protein